MSGQKVVDIWDLDIPGLDDFDHMKYYEGERDILNPGLKALGYKTLGPWYTSEGDSFGPLIRSKNALDPEGNRVIIFYG